MKQVNTSVEISERAKRGMDQAVTQQDLTAKIPERDGPSSDTTGPYSQDTREGWTKQ